MEIIQLNQELMKLYRVMNKEIEQLYEQAEIKAETERDFRKNLAQEQLKLKAEGMSVTLIPDLAKGICADLMFARDIAEDRFIATREAIQLRQVQASMLQTVIKIQREV